MASVILNNREVSFAGAVILMDNEIREELHEKMTPCTEQEFIDAYVKAHAEKFNGEKFDV